MQLKLLKTTLLIFIFFQACHQPNEFFIGKWQIVNVVEDNTPFDLKENWMHLKSDGTFESYDGDLKKREYGRWNYQPGNKILFIDGEGKTEDSQWNISLKNDTLVFHSTAHNLYLIAKKIK